MGWWSRYDLFPHVLTNVASPAYHALHVNQLTAMNVVVPRAEFVATAAAFAAYAGSRPNSARAWAAKAAFRLAVPRNARLARHWPGAVRRA